MSKTLLKAGLAAVALVGLSCGAGNEEGTTAADGSKEAREAVETTAEYLAEQRGRYQDEAEERIAELEKRGDALTERVGEAQEDLLQDPRGRLEVARARLRDLQEKTDESWEELKDGVENAIEDLEGYLPIQSARSSEELFGLRVRGESMSGVGILSGDVVIVRRQPEARSGEIVVALVGDEATVKRLRMRGRRVELHPENPDFDVIVPDTLTLLGKVVEVRRYLERA
jgi:phage repressor protein C with HTH and peptisase S24 domain